MEKSLLVFQTDFTYQEGAVAAMYGVVKSVDRSLEIIDATHQIPQFDTWSASYRLYQYMRFWPAGTVFVSVVDPGVGTPRKASVARVAGGYYVVTPDNGALTHLKAWMGIEEVREIDESVNRLTGKGTDEVAIFHGRDLFGYCAARLAAGIITFEEVGPAYPLEDIVSHPIAEPKIEDNSIKGIFEICDPNFGNLWTNIPRKMFFDFGFQYGDRVNMRIIHGGKEVFSDSLLFHQSFGYAEKGEAMIYNNELMKIAVSVSQGSFRNTYKVDFGPDWEVEFSR